MYELSAHAVRHGNFIEVTVIGFLPTSCHQAHVADIYPGGNIMYVKDPGEAQVFIEERVHPGIVFCPMVLVPWAVTTIIPDKEHGTVSIFVNNRECLQVPVEEKAKTQFIVLKLTGGIVPDGDYSIVPAGAYFPSIYTKVFGPATYADCERWIEQNDHLPFALLDGVALGFGGGGGAPHGAHAAGGGSGNPRGLSILIQQAKNSGAPRG